MSHETDEMSISSYSEESEESQNQQLGYPPLLPHPLPQPQDYPEDRKDFLMKSDPDQSYPTKAKEEDDIIIGPTRLDLYRCPVDDWAELMEDFRCRASSTSATDSPNYQTIFCHDPYLRTDFQQLEDYRQDITIQAIAFLNAIPGADSEAGNKTVTPMARQAKEGMLQDLPRVQKLDALLQRRGHMMRLAEWFLDQTSIFWVRAYHPMTTFSEGTFWWCREDDQQIGDIGWAGPYMPDIFEFDAWEFESFMVKDGTVEAYEKYSRILTVVQETQVFENACFIRAPPIVELNQTTGKYEQDPPDPEEEEFRGWEEEADAWARAEGEDEVWEKPNRYIAAAFVVAGAEENLAYTWIQDIAFRFKLDVEMGLVRPVIVRSRFAVPEKGRTSVSKSAESPWQGEVKDWQTYVGSAKK